MYDAKSRYSEEETYRVTDSRGRSVEVVAVPGAPEQVQLGVHRRTYSQRLDHLAHRYLNNAAGSWRICELNDVMLPEALSEALEIGIPVKAR